MRGLTLQWRFAPYAPGSNASGFAVVAVSALPVSLMPTVPPARAGVVPVGNGAPSHSHATMPGDSISLAMAFVTMEDSQDFRAAKEDR